MRNRFFHVFSFIKAVFDHILQQYTQHFCIAQHLQAGTNAKGDKTLTLGGFLDDWQKNQQQ